MKNRPFGVAVIVAGIERGVPRMFHLDPSGTYTDCAAKAIGSASEGAMQQLEEQYHSVSSTCEQYSYSLLGEPKNGTHKDFALQNVIFVNKAQKIVLFEQNAQKISLFKIVIFVNKAQKVVLFENRSSHYVIKSSRKDDLNPQ